MGKNQEQHEVAVESCGEERNASKDQPDIQGQKLEAKFQQDLWGT